MRRHDIALVTPPLRYAADAAATLLTLMLPLIRCYDEARYDADAATAKRFDATALRCHADDIFAMPALPLIDMLRDAAAFSLLPC